VLTAQGRPDGLPRSNEFLVKMQARDAAGQVVTGSLVVWANPYDHPPVVTPQLIPSSWHTATALPTSNLAADADYTTTWDGLLEARWDWDEDGNWDTPFANLLNPGRVFTQTGRYTFAVEVQDRFGAFAIATKTVDILPPPQLTLASQVNLTVTQNQTATFPLLLGNTGVLTLTYVITEADPLNVTYSVTSSLAMSSLYAWDNPFPGGIYPGYVATAPPRPARDEGHSGLISLNWEFPFFGQVYTQAYAVTNGYLTFLPPYADLGAGTLPTGSVSLLWADYDMSTYGSWVYNNLSNRERFLFEYDYVVRAGFPYTDARTFQSVLYPDGAIKVQYQSITGTATLPAALRSPQGGDVISYTGPLTNQMAVSFRPIYGPVDWLSVDATSGSRAAATTAPISLTVDSGGLLLGSYAAWLMTQTNDPYNPYRIVHVNLQIVHKYDIYLPVVTKQ
jgi:hypothetical protein